MRELIFTDFAVFADFSKKNNFVGTYFRGFVWKNYFAELIFAKFCRINLFLAFFAKLLEKSSKMLFCGIYFHFYIDSRKKCGVSTNFLDLMTYFDLQIVGCIDSEPIKKFQKLCVDISWITFRIITCLYLQNILLLKQKRQYFFPN